jgi:serine/threonine protein kinase
MPFGLLNCLARAVAKNGVKFLVSFVPGGAAVYDIAADALEHYRLDRHEGALRAEVQALAQAPPDQVRREVEAAVQAEAAGQPPQVRQAMAAYLGQVPAAIRRSLRRPSDPTGTTVPPDLALRGPDDLVPLLPPRPPRFKPGDRPLPGVDWELEELVGVGGFGEVWKARHAHLRSKPPVALKFCLDASAVVALRNEAGVLDRVMQHGRHPGIVPLLQTYLSADPPCLEYEFIEGGDLAGLIREQYARGKMALALANRLFQRLTEIVAFAHRADPPIVHGDLKPANVLVRRGTEGKIGLRVTDFGIGGLAAAQAAREATQPTRSRQELVTDAVRGAYTPLYASPEQMARRRGEPADPRDDVHALGVIWYQLLTGDLGMMSIPPDWREQVQERGLSEDLIRLLASCLAPRAEKRPPSAIDLADRLAALLEEEPAGPPATPSTLPPPLPPVPPLVVRPVPVAKALPPPVARPAPSPPLPVLEELPQEVRPIRRRSAPLLTCRALVVEDPAGILQGKLQVEVAAGGLTLRQRNKTELVLPVGSPARYLGQTRIAVRYKGREIKLALYRGRSYQRRLARDVVAFLQGKKRALDAEDYRRSLGMYAITLLP